MSSVRPCVEELATLTTQFPDAAIACWISGSGFAAVGAMQSTTLLRVGPTTY
jgi:hypothetical protein